MKTAENYLAEANAVAASAAAVIKPDTSPFVAFVAMLISP